MLARAAASPVVMFARATAPLVCLCTLVGAATGCNAGGAGDSSVAVTVDSSRGYPVVRSSGEPAAWTAELVATMGIDSTGISTFGTVRSVLLDSSGAGYVLDPSYHQIHVFEPDGRFREMWGRRGSGPEEFSSPYSIAWLGDSMAIFDAGNARITVLDRDGKWARQWPTARRSGGNILRLYRTPPGGFWTVDSRKTDSGKLERTFVRYTSAGPSDTLTWFVQSSLSQGFALCEFPGGFSEFDPPFGPMPLVIPNAAGEQVVAASADYRIAFIGGNSDTLRVIERPVEPEVVTDVEWEESQSELQDWRKENPNAHCNRTGWDRVATKPPLKSIFTDDEGQLRVEVLTADGLVYDVFSMDGTLRASVRGLPPTGDIDPSVVAGRIAIVVKDSLDVQSVKVFRLGR